MENQTIPCKALVLAGGGARGSYQVGVWKALMELDWHPQIITGKLGGIEQLDNRKTVAVVDYKGFRVIIPIKE